MTIVELKSSAWAFGWPVSKFRQFITTCDHRSRLKPISFTVTSGAFGSDSAIPFSPSGTAGNTNSG